MSDANPSRPDARPKPVKVTTNKDGTVTLPDDYDLPRHLRGHPIRRDPQTNQLYVERTRKGFQLKTWLKG